MPVSTAADSVESVSAAYEAVRHCVRASGTTEAAAIALWRNDFFIVLYLSIILFTRNPMTPPIVSNYLMVPPLCSRSCIEPGYIFLRKTYKIIYLSQKFIPIF